MAAADGPIVIVGAGLVGALLATVLARRGYRVTVYERYGDIRAIPSSGRSINLVATARGLRALTLLPDDVRARLLELGVRVTGRVIHAGGEPIFQRYGKDDSEFNYSISRYELNKFLISEAEAAGATLRFGHRLLGVELEGEYPVLTFAAPHEASGQRGVLDSALHAEDNTGAEREVVVRCGGPVVAADGGGSAVRQALSSAGACAVHSSLLDSGYKEMSFPRAAAEAGGMARHGLHIWPRGSHMLMGLANLDGSFTGTIYMLNQAGDATLADDASAGASFEEVEAQGVASAAAFLEAHYATALPLLGGVEAAARQLAENPRGILGTVRARQWAVGGKAVLVGDAAHAIVPFFGQGMNCGFEDVHELVRLLDEHAAPAIASPAGYAAAFAAFEAARKPNADAIADMALENYVEMQSSTAEPQFRLCKAVENALENSPLGARFRSRYAMVCYGGAGNVTYANAQALGRVQWEIVLELAKGVSSAEEAAAQLDVAQAERLLAERLEPLQKELQVDLATVSHAA